LLKKLKSIHISNSSPKAENSIYEKKEVSKRISGIECEVLSNNSQPDYVVFIFHGYGANAEDLKSLAQVYLQNIKETSKVRFVLPEGLVSLGVNQSCWWPLDLQKLLMAIQIQDLSILDEEPFGIQNVRDKITSLIKEVVEECKHYNSNFSISKNVILAGFSQGAMLSVDLALHLPEVPSAIIALSAGVICKKHWEKEMGKLKGVPVLQSHGLDDPILPFNVGKILHNLLVQGGANVSFVEFDGAHAIPEQVVLEYVNFLLKHHKK